MVVYRFVRFLIMLALRQFFSKITVRGTAVETGSALIVGNHQNFALDSLTISLAFKRQLWYLAKAPLFKNPILGGFLRSLHVAPLFRKQDDPTQMSKNAETFRAVSEILNQKKAVLLFPEGVSLGERKLQPIKTGAARMAFQAEEQGGFSTGMVIQPAGLTYSDLAMFRGTVTVVLGEPIPVALFHERWRQDQVAAVRELTEAIEEGLRKVSVEVADQGHVVLVEKIGKLYQSAGKGADDFERLSVIAKNVETISPTHPEVRADIEAELDRFNELCSIFQTGIEDQHLPSERHAAIKILLLSPLVLLGAVILQPPYLLIKGLVAKYCRQRVYVSSVKFLVGVVLIPLWALALALLGVWGGLSMLQGLGLFALILLLGIITNWYLPELRARMLCSLWPGGRTPGEFIAAEKLRLVEKLEKLRIA